MYLNDGLTGSFGQTWQNLRTTLASRFHYDAILSYIPIMENSCHQILNSLKPKTKIRVLRETQKISSLVTLRSFFGKDIDDI